MGFDWELYCLEWVTFFGAIGLTWPLIGACLDIIIFGVERDVGPTGNRRDG